MLFEAHFLAKGACHLRAVDPGFVDRDRSSSNELMVKRTSKAAGVVIGTREGYPLMRIEETIEIGCPPERVYEFMANVNNLPRCSSAVHEVRGAPESPVSQGDTYTTVAKVLGRKIETSHRVTSADPPNRLVIEGTTDRISMRVTITFEPTDSGTRVTQVGEGEPGGALRLVRPVFERTVKNQMRSDLDTLKQVLEQSN